MCMGCCNVEVGLKRKASATAIVKLEVDVDLELKKKVSDLLFILKDVVEWELNVMVECCLIDVDNYLFEYVIMVCTLTMRRDDCLKFWLILFIFYSESKWEK